MYLLFTNGPIDCRACPAWYSDGEGERGDSEQGKLEKEMTEGQTERQVLKGFLPSLGEDRVMPSDSLSSLPPLCGDPFLSHLKTGDETLQTEKMAQHSPKIWQWLKCLFKAFFHLTTEEPYFYHLCIFIIVYGACKEFTDYKTHESSGQLPIAPSFNAVPHLLLRP